MAAFYEPPPPYLPHDPATPAATSASTRLNPVIFHIGFLEREYRITSEHDNELGIKVQPHEWSLKPDLIFYRGKEPTKKTELASCEFREKTCSVDMAVTKDSFGDRSTLWWSAMDPETSIFEQFRFMAKVRNANPLGISGLSLTSPRPFVWKCSSDWKLVDELTGNVAAIAHNVNSASGQHGSLEILMTYGDKFSLITLTSYLTLCEKRKRDAKKNRLW
ncbi:uncharacterized protein N7483_011318 [Penicillium malachiteum]|uniref:uncharacterized protein n=1 Tax=Penicillium malachiteum TaxID=1324776 RepID=UPI002547D69F|nr:uncharacterized protein N7483_011318 [Penicillium malachiteum]KAJ5714137.1 hypothetical protein N7483_011318 [Penicillium malachiteum]